MKNVDERFILESLGVKVLRNPPVHLDSSIKFLGCLNGFFIYPYRYYWIVSGKMPFKFAKELYKYSEELGIRISGGSSSNTPEEWCTSDEYENYSNKLCKDINTLGVNKVANLLEETKKELMNNNIDDFYIDIYHVDTIDGLKKVVDTIKLNNIKTNW